MMIYVQHTTNPSFLNKISKKKKKQQQRENTLVISNEITVPAAAVAAAMHTSYRCVCVVYIVYVYVSKYE